VISFENSHLTIGTGCRGNELCKHFVEIDELQAAVCVAGVPYTLGLDLRPSVYIAAQLRGLVEGWEQKQWVASARTREGFA